MIFVPRSFIPSNELECATLDQHLTVALRDYLPRLVEENLDQMPYLAELLREAGVVKANYSTEREVHEGFWVVLEVAGISREHKLSPKATIDIRSSLREALLDWFRSKDVELPRLAVDIEWERVR